MLPNLMEQVNGGFGTLLSFRSHTSPIRVSMKREISPVALKHSRLTRKWTLADIRRLDCSIMKTKD